MEQIQSERRVSETETIRSGITDAMVLAGVRALAECEERREAGGMVTDSDLVCAIYASMHRSKESASPR